MRRQPAKLSPGLPRNQSLQRAVEILRVLADHPRGVTGTEVALACGLPRPTASRLLATLADSGLAERLPDGDGWVLGYEATRLGRAADPYGVLVRRSQKHLEALTEQTGESSLIAVTRFPLDIEIVNQVDASSLVGVQSWVGRRFALHASVSGKLAYARLPEPLRDELLEQESFERYTDHTIADADEFRRELDRVRRQGYALSVDELELGLTMIGVDVASPVERDFVLSVGIMGPTSRLSRSALHDAIAAVRDCARRLASIS